MALLNVCSSCGSKHIKRGGYTFRENVQISLMFTTLLLLPIIGWIIFPFYLSRAPYENEPQIAYSPSTVPLGSGYERKAVCPQTEPAHFLGMEVDTELWLVTGYAVGDNYTPGRNTADGWAQGLEREVRPGITVACPMELPLGTMVLIDGLGARVCEDRGRAIVGKRLDVAFAMPLAAEAWGRRWVRVAIIHGDAQGTIDYFAPLGSVVVNGGAINTTSRDVALQLLASDDVSGLSAMAFSNDATNYSSWETYTDSKAWTLSGGDGEKTVYVKYKDEAGNTSVYTDTVVLDTTVPPEYGVSINEGASFTNQISVTLSLGAPAYTAQMRVSNDVGFAGETWEPYATHREWQISQYGDYVIPRTVYVQYEDTDGTISSTYQDDIVLDVTLPTGSVTIVPAVGASLTAGSSAGINSSSEYPYKVFLPLVFKGYPPPLPAPNVTLLLSADDDVSGVGYMLIGNGPSFAGAAWESYATSKQWHVNETGTTTVYVKYKDNAGNVSEVYSDTIDL